MECKRSNNNNRRLLLLSLLTFFFPITRTDISGGEKKASTGCDPQPYFVSLVFFFSNENSLSLGGRSPITSLRLPML